MKKSIIGCGATAALAVGIVLAPSAEATPFTPEWVGTWQSGGASGPARVHLYSFDPIEADIEIPGMCNAQWSENERISQTNRLVYAHVTSGPCVDNTWDVTILPTASLQGVDRAHPGTSFSFRPATSADMGSN